MVPSIVQGDQVRITLAKAQRIVCIIVAWSIVLLQLASFIEIGGIAGSEWQYSFVIAAAFGLLGTRRITGEPLVESQRDAVGEIAANRQEIADYQRRFLRDADVLLVEIDSAVLAMDIWVPRPPHFDAEGQKNVDRAKAHADYLVFSRQKESALMLALGLVGIRRAGVNRFYISGQEYLYLEHKISIQMLDVAINTETLGSAANVEKVMTRLRADLEKVREFVLEATMSDGDRYHRRARPLIKWAVKRGLNAPVDHPFFRSLVMSVEEWGVDSAVDAYMGAGYSAMK